MHCSSCGQPLDDGSRFCKYCGSATPCAPSADEAESEVVRVRAGDLLEGKWRLESKLGQGGMGSVYLAHDLSLDRKVAIKVLAAELCDDEEFVARFEREAKLTANLEHPNVVTVYAVGKQGGRPFIVMKLLEGNSLARHLRQREGKGLPTDEVLSIMRQLCDGLGFIHAKGFVHRDIKGGNIIISPTGHATILDFGILRDTKQDQGLTRAGVMMGTPHYMSPEQALGKTIDHRADLYALGCLLYECLVGVLPFRADNDFHIIQAHVKSPPPDPCAEKPSLPKQVGAVVVKALAKKAADRYQSAAELYAALEAALKPQPKQEEQLEPTEPTEPGLDGMQTRVPVTPRRAARPATPVAASPSTPASARGRTPAGAHRPTRPSQRMAVVQKTPARAPVREAPEPEEPEVDDRAPTPPRGTAAQKRPAAAPAPSSTAKKTSEIPAKKSGANPILLLLVFLGLGGLGYFAYTSLKEAEQDSKPVSTELAPIEPTDEPGTPPPGFAPPQAQPPVAEPEPTAEPAQPAEPPAQEEPATAEAPKEKQPKRPSAPKTTASAAAPAPQAGAADYGTLRVVTMNKGEPLWATVFLNGQKKGETPVSLDLAPGSYSVAIERAGFKRIEQQVTVGGGAVVPLKLELEPAGP